MLESLLHADTDLFLAVNHARNGFFDFIAPWLSSRWIWIPLYAWFAVVLFRYYSSKAVVIIVAVGVMIVVSDQGANLFKNNVQRPRPCHNPELLSTQTVYTPEGCGGPFGFFSAHASNSFSLALIMFLLIRRKNQDGWRPWLWIFAWCSAIAWSRVYLGVHYPGDVICGAVYGLLIGTAAYVILTKFYLDKRNA